MRIITDLRRFWRTGEGATAIEFAIVALPFLMLIMAILQTGIIYAFYLELGEGVANARRNMMTGVYKIKTAGDVKLFFCQNTLALMATQNKYANGDAVVGTFFRPVLIDCNNNLNVPVIVTPGSGGAGGFCLGNQDSVVTITATYSIKMPVTFSLFALDSSGGYTVSATTAYINVAAPDPPC